MMRILLVTILFFAALESTYASYIPKSFSGLFEQQKQRMFNRGVSKTQISLKYSYPGNIYMHSEGPDENVYYICNPEKVWIYNPPFIEGQEGRVVIGNSSKYCLSKIFDKLQNGLKSNKQYSVKEINKRSYELNLSKENEKRLGYYKFKLVFESDQADFLALKLMKMYVRNDDNPTILVKKKLKKAKKFKRTTFEFSPPKNTAIDYM